jgi:hypothetical protein
MPDLIDNVALTPKLSYEDAIMPAEAFQGRVWRTHRRVGRVDVDILARRSPIKCAPRCVN